MDPVRAPSPGWRRRRQRERDVLATLAPRSQGGVVALAKELPRPSPPDRQVLVVGFPRPGRR